MGRIAQKRKRKTNCAIIKSFPWPILSLSMALDQSVREKSLCYCKIIVYF